MASFLLQPFAQICFRERPYITIAGQDDGGVLRRRYTIDEEIIVSGYVGHQMGEATRLKEEFFSVRQVTSYPHIGMPAEGCSQIMESVKKRIEAHEAVDMSFRTEIGAEAKDDLGGLFAISHWLLAFKSCHHLMNPMGGFGHTIGVGQQEVVVLRCFCSQRKGQFLRRTHPCAVRHKGHAQTRVIDHITLHDSACLIFGAIVHNDHLVGRPVLRKERLKILGEIVSLVMGGNYYGNTRCFRRTVSRLLLAISFFISADEASGGGHVAGIEIELR